MDDLDLDAGDSIAGPKRGIVSACRSLSQGKIRVVSIALDRAMERRPRGVMDHHARQSGYPVDADLVPEDSTLLLLGRAVDVF
jgi:hypothetical protein